MRLLLPPSEGKNPGGRGAALAPDRYGDAPLGAHRRRLCAEVEAVARGPRPAAVAAFRLPAAVADDAIAANRTVCTAGTRPALDRYAGVVYSGLAYAAMTPAQRRVANRSILVFSGLFGVLTAGERVPDYRVPAAAVLPEIGPVGASWRAVLGDVMATRLGRTGLVLDLRSTDYAAMWRPDSTTAGRVITARVLSPRTDGPPAVISYFSKDGKGRLANALVAHVASGGPVRTAADVAEVWSALTGGDAIITGRGTRTSIDLVTR